MTPSIEFIAGIREEVLPIINLTKSKNGRTGTATFIFIEPSIFKNVKCKIIPINGIYLLWEKQQIESTDIKIFFKKGKPFILKAIFIFKNNQEWFNFLQFMNLFSKKTGLSFTEKFEDFKN